MPASVLPFVRHPLSTALLTLFAAPALAQTTGSTTLPPLEVRDQRPYTVNESASPKLPEPLLDTPRSINVVTGDLLDDQGSLSLVDALRNVTGIAIQAGEGNPPSGDQFKIRGFLARDAVLVDGARQVGSFFRDPFNAEAIEVTKGPAGAFVGGGAAGGAINLISKRPSLRNAVSGEVGLGTDALARVTVDANQRIGQTAALRLNAMAHTADVPRRDFVEQERYGVAPSLALGLGTPTRLSLSGEFTRQDNRPDHGLPNVRGANQDERFRGRVAPVAFSNFYGYLDDYEEVESRLLTGLIEHSFSPALSLRNQLRHGEVRRDLAVSSPRFVGNTAATIDENTQVLGNRKYRDQTDDILINQTDLTTRFETGPVRHTLVAGLEVSRERTENRRRLDDNGPAYALFTPGPAQSFVGNIPNFNGTRVQLETDRTGLYLLDSIAITPQWLANVGIRYDEVRSTVRGIDDVRDADATPPRPLTGFITDLTQRDREFTYNLGLVYKPVDAGSVYLGYGTGFEASGRADVVQVAGGNNNPPTTAARFNIDPEKTRTLELGTKWEVLDRQLTLNAAVFRVDKTNARVPGLPGDPAIVLDGEQRADGVELSASGRLTPQWTVFGGYTFLDGKVRRSNNASEVGQRLDNTPEHSLSLWTGYRFLPQLEAAVGLQYVGERVSNIRSDRDQNIPIEAASYTLLDLMLRYRINQNLALRVNGYNLTDEDYVFQLTSAQSIPGPGRSGVLSLEWKL